MQTTLSNIFSKQYSPKTIHTRLRVNGVRLSSKEEFFSVILELLRDRPMTPTEIGRVLQKSREHLYRAYLKPMLLDGSLEKIPGTQKYQPKGFGHDLRSVKFIALTEDEFFQCHTIARWLRHAKKTKNELSAIKSFKRLCMGVWTPKFRINPDTWVHPFTTETCVNLLLEESGKTKLHSDKRGIIRHFLKYGLEQSLSSDSLKSLGIGGHKDKIGAYAHVSFENGQYDKAINWFKHNAKHKLSFFGFRFWTFCRPSMAYTIQLDQLRFYSRVTEYVKINNSSCVISHVDDVGKRIIINPSLYHVAKQHRLKIRQKKELACFVEDFKEFKTGKTYPKYILDDIISKELKHLVNNRKKQGFRYLFWDNNKTKFTFENYTHLVTMKKIQDNKMFKKMFSEIGCTGNIFQSRANYAIRHVGVQHWLEMTNHDFDFVTDMGWEDINTLRQWYGRRNRRQFERQLAQVMA